MGHSGALGTEKKLAVIIGAGASKDCVAQGEITQFDQNYTPPLTSELFEPRPTFNQILRNYPKAQAVSEEIRTRLRSKESLESVLKEMENVRNFQVQKQIWEVALYIQELLWTISDRFIQSGGSKFDTLVRAVLASSLDRVMFLTLNYDLFLDKAIAGFDDHEFRELSHCCPRDRKWLLIKPHGSVNWIKELLSGIPQIPQGAGNNPYTFLSLLGGPPQFAESIEIMQGTTGLAGFEVLRRFRNGKYLYPALALPVQGAKTFACPDEHIEQARAFLSDCTCFLFLGYSGFDPHVNDLFKQGPVIKKLKVVSRNKDSARRVLERLPQRMQQFPPDELGDSLLHAEGFASFIESNEFRKFLEEI